MKGTRRLVLAGGVGLLLAEGTEAKRRKKKSNNKNNKKNDKKHKKKHKKNKPSTSGPVDYDAILADLATKMRFGLRDDQLSVDALEKKLSSGEIIECQCTNHALMGVRAVRRAGGRARVVGAFLYPFNEGPNTGHVMMEVRMGSQWVCYDIMCNVQALDANGNPCSLETWCASSEHRWRRIADDETAYPLEQHLAAIYDRLLDTPWVGVKDSPFGAIFYDPDPSDAALIMKNYSWLDKVSLSEWKRAMS
jgi:hypothetical protein